MRLGAGGVPPSTYGVPFLGTKFATGWAVGAVGSSVLVEVGVGVEVGVEVKVCVEGEVGVGGFVELDSAS